MTPLYFRHESAIARPSLTPLFGDAECALVLPMATNTPSRDLYFSDYPGIDFIGHYTLARHGGRGTARGSIPLAPGESMGSWVNNLVCYDGHVERAKLDNLWNYYWHKNWEPPAKRPR